MRFLFLKKTCTHTYMEGRCHYWDRPRNLETLLKSPRPTIIQKPLQRDVKNSEFQGKGVSIKLLAGSNKYQIPWAKLKRRSTCPRLSWSSETQCSQMEKFKDLSQSVNKTYLPLEKDYKHLSATPLNWLMKADTDLLECHQCIFSARTHQLPILRENLLGITQAHQVLAFAVAIILHCVVQWL